MVAQPKLFTPGFRGGSGGEVGGELVGGERFDVEADEADGGDAEIDGAVGAIDEHGHGGDDAVMGAHDGDGFPHAAALGDDVFDEENFFTGRDFEAATEDEFAFLLFHKNETQAKLACDFLADDESAHRGRDDGGGAEGPEFFRERAAEFFDDRHLLQREGALEKLAAVQPAAEDEVAFEERAGFAEKSKGFGVRHAARV